MSWKDLRFAPAPHTFVCDLDQIPDLGGREAIFGTGKEPFRLLLLRRGEQVWGYHNSCPHFSLPLNFEPQHFITQDGELIMCAHHTAFFKFDDGMCVDGPCAGSALLSIPIYIANGSVFVDDQSI